MTRSTDPNILNLEFPPELVKWINEAEKENPGFNLAEGIPKRFLTAVSEFCQGKPASRIQGLPAFVLKFMAQEFYILYGAHIQFLEKVQAGDIPLGVLIEALKRGRVDFPLACEKWALIYKNQMISQAPVTPLASGEKI